ncbi:CotH kinase family protein [Actinocorallia populi]|uniref:CotH kinase family protein n=1 Tax=Actinocorallia populi TaxID=2079200 RepID=UPI000D08B6DA|nr:CotH kinase family protein [Actinocorallia populi]
MPLPPHRPKFRHRLPVRLRHHWRLVAASGAFVLVLGVGLGTETIRPYATTAEIAAAETVTQDIAGLEDVFDRSAAHDVTLTFKDAAYEDMLEEYFEDGGKKYVEADLVIDGTAVPSVGVRLKGNSTLMGLTWKGETSGARGGGRPAGMEPPGGTAVPEGAAPPEGGRMPEGLAEGGPPGGGGRQQLKAEEPEDLPWLISFDEFVDGRRYQGLSQLAVRPSLNGSTLLNEALALTLTGEAGEPTQEYAYGSFTVNGRSSAPRLLIGHPDEAYAEELGDGVLYKSLASGSFTYKGEDQTDYADDFKQINRKGARDLQPVIDLIRWTEDSSDEEFAQGLADRLDTESFARYLALQNLMTNFDDMSGPGRNYYLWYDLTAKKFKVVSWDLNYAFNGDAEAGATDSLAMGGRNGGRPQGQARQDTQDRRPARQDHPGGGMRMGHALKDRFLKSAAFKDVYAEQYRLLYRDLLADGTAASVLDGIIESYRLNEGADTDRAASDAAALRTTLRARIESLSTDETVTG